MSKRTLKKLYTEYLELSLIYSNSFEATQKIKDIVDPRIYEIIKKSYQKVAIKTADRMHDIEEIIYDSMSIKAKDRARTTIYEVARLQQLTSINV